MRKMYLMLLMIFSAVSVMAQKQDVKESEVAAAVRNSFFAKYPDAKTRTWKMKNGEYEVDFFIGMKKYEAKYEADGKWKKTAMDIDKKNLPAEVIDAWRGSDFGKWMLDKIEQVETPEHKALYLVKVIKGMNEMELLYTPAGQLLKAKDKNSK
jgi:hypothetical protein